MSTHIQKLRFKKITYRFYINDLSIISFIYFYLLFVVLKTCLLFNPQTLSQVNISFDKILSIVCD